MLRVASRAGADVRIPGAHPLRHHVQPIIASEAATEIQHAARSELERALKAPEDSLPLGLLPGGSRRWADFQRTAFLLKRRGRDSTLARSKACSAVPSAAVSSVFPIWRCRRVMSTFAHDSLLTEARVLLTADLGPMKIWSTLGRRLCPR